MLINDLVEYVYKVKVVSLTFLKIYVQLDFIYLNNENYVIE